jgi:hypothetical protein
MQRLMTFILAAGFAGTAAAHELLVVGGVVAYRLLRRITE